MRSRLILVVIDDLDVVRVTVTPPEADSPLGIDPKAVLAPPIAAQRLELVGRRNRQVLQISRGIDLLQLHQRASLNFARQSPGVLAAPNLLGFLATEGFDHWRIVTSYVSTVKR